MNRQQQRGAALRILLAVIVVLVTAVSWFFLDAENPITGEEQRIS